MPNIAEQVVQRLNRIIRINHASEKGYSIAAENVRNRGLKIMFKTYAQERAQFADRLSDIVLMTGGAPARRSGLLAAFHRGWINIKSAMTIGEADTEQVVLSEVVRGDRVAMQRYAEALANPLPDEVRQIIVEQQERIEEVYDRVQHLVGRGDSQLVVRLFNDDAAVAEAKQNLEEAGYAPENVQEVLLDDLLKEYEPGNLILHTTRESALAGAVVGTAIGALIGLAAGIGTVIMPGEPLFSMGVGASVFVTVLLGALVGLLFGGLMGAILGLGVSQDDAHRYAASIARGSSVLMLATTPERAQQAGLIMKKVNARRWGLDS